MILKRKKKYVEIELMILKTKIKIYVRNQLYSIYDNSKFDSFNPPRFKKILQCIIKMKITDD